MTIKLLLSVIGLWSIMFLINCSNTSVNNNSTSAQNDNAEILNEADTVTNWLIRRKNYLKNSVNRINKAKFKDKFPKYGIPNFSQTIILQRPDSSTKALLFPSYNENNRLSYILLANSDLENYNYQYLKIEELEEQNIMDDFINFDYRFPHNEIRNNLEGLLNIKQPSKDKCWQKSKTYETVTLTYMC